MRDELEKQHYHSFFASDLYHLYISTQEHDEEEEMEDLDNLSIVSSQWSFSEVLHSVCVCACVCACVHVCVRAYMHACVCVCACIHACVRVCVNHLNTFTIFCVFFRLYLNTGYFLFF